MTTSQSRRGLITIGAAAVAVFVAQLAAIIILGVTEAAGNRSPIGGDPGLYNVIATAIFNGAVPYIEYPLEHLPGSLVPMLAVEGLARFTGATFESLWPTAMGLAFVITVGLANLFPTSFDSGRRLLRYSLPLLPLVLYRVEPWLMLWVVASMMFAFRRSWPAQVLATAVASLTKGWPLLLLALPFQLSRKNLAIVSAVVTFTVLAAIAATPGFREGREFAGIHSETVVGGLVIAARALRGVDVQLISAAGAAYVAVPGLAVLLNALIGLPFLVFAGVHMFRTSDPTRIMKIVGIGVLGVILASPLFSAQFVFWLVPFVILIGIRSRLLFLVASVLTLANVIVWDPETVLWSLLVVTRNALLIGLGIAWAREVVASRSPDPSDNPLEHVA